MPRGRATVMLTLLHTPGYAAVQKATAMTLLSSILYSPLYCVAFLLLRSALEGQRPAIIGARFKRFMRA